MRLLPRNPEGSWLPYVWLIYLGFFLLYPVLGRPTPREWALTIAGLVAFLVLYFTGYWLKGPRVLWAAGGIPHAVFPTTFAELVAVTGGEPADVA